MTNEEIDKIFKLRTQIEQYESLLKDFKETIDFRRSGEQTTMYFTLRELNIMSELLLRELNTLQEEVKKL